MIFDSIVFSYNSKPILRGVYLAVPQNSITGLFGLNGCGKSTLLNIGAGFLRQNEGNIFINSELVKNSLSLARFNMIGYLSQDSFLPRDLKVIDFFNIGNQTNDFLIENETINNIKNKKISTLSGGELRYLETFLLFNLNREYYLLDEPFTGIEPKMIEQIITLIVKQKENAKGILITDHYLRYVTDIIDKCYLLKDGYMKEINHNNNINEELLKAGYLINY